MTNKNHGLMAITLVVVTLSLVSGCMGKTASTGSARVASAEAGQDKEQPLHQAAKFLKRNMGMVAPDEACDAGRSNAWFIQYVYSQVTPEGGSGDEGGFTAGPTPEITQEDTPVELAMSGQGWPAGVHLAFNRPQSPWSVVIRRDTSAMHIYADGYGEDLQKPLFSEEIK